MNNKAKRKPQAQQPSRMMVLTTGLMLTILALFLCAMTFTAVGEPSLSSAEMTATAASILPNE